MSDKKELNLDELEKASGGSNLFNESVEEARGKYIHAIGDEVDVNADDGTRAKGKVTKRGIAHSLYCGVAHRYDNYYFCEVPSVPRINGWYKCLVDACSFGPKSEVELDLRETEE